MNLKYVGILSAFAVSAVMAQAPAEQAALVAPAPIAEPVVEQTAPAPAPEVAPAPAPEVAPTPVQEAPVNEVAEPTAVRGADAAKPVPSKKKKFVYRPVYTPSEVETSGHPVKTIYVTEKARDHVVDSDDLRGLVPMKFNFGVQGFVGTDMLSGDNGRYQYDRYYGMTWSAGVFAIFPLDEYNMGFKTGIMFEHSKVSNSFNEVYKEAFGEWRISFSQYRLSIPLLLSLKAARSSFSFDLGVQPSFALADKFRMNYSKDKSMNRKDDMMDNDCRQALDWSLVFGLSLRANRYVGFDARINWGINSMYDGYDGYGINNLSSTSFTVGATFYAF